MLLPPIIFTNSKSHLDTLREEIETQKQQIQKSQRQVKTYRLRQTKSYMQLKKNLENTLHYQSAGKQEHIEEGVR